MSHAAEIRRAIPADRAAIGRLWQELMDFHRALQPDAFVLAPDALERWLEFLDRCIAAEDHVVLVAHTGKRLVGYVVGKLDQGPPVYDRRELGSIMDTCVTAEWRRRGVGHQLVSALLDWFRSRELTEVHVSAAACNSVSNAFWRAMGFQPHMIRMRRSLE